MKTSESKKASDRAYYIRNREKLKASAKARYLANPEKVKAAAKAWGQAHPEAKRKLRQKSASNVDARWTNIVSSAKRRRLPKFVNLDQMNLLKEKMMNACFYCGFAVPEGHRLNGLDCVDPNEGYTVENTVSACTPCNIMKNIKTIDAFVSHVRRVICEPATGPPASIPQILRKSQKPTSKLNDLSKERITSLHLSHCTYCGLFPALGIDRMNSSVHYTSENSVACCTECNLAKNDLSIDEFQRHIGHIAYHTRHWVLQPSCPLMNLRKKAPEYCYHGICDGRQCLTIRPTHHSIPKNVKWDKHASTEFNTLFEKFFRGPLEKYDVKKVRDAREYMGKRLTRDYLDGVDLTAMHVENALG